MGAQSFFFRSAVIDDLLVLAEAIYYIPFVDKKDESFDKIYTFHSLAPISIKNITISGNAL